MAGATRAPILFRLSRGIRFSMKNKKSKPLLLSDDLVTGGENEKRSQAVRKTVEALAQALGASITAVHVDEKGMPASRDLKPLYEEQLKSMKSALVRGFEGSSMPAKPLLLTGHPVQKLLSLCSQKTKFELIAQGTHGRKGIGRMLMGSVAEEIIRNSKIPVLTLGRSAQERPLETLASGAKIVLGTDLSANSSRAEAYAHALSRRIKAEIVLVHGLRDSLHPTLQIALSSPRGAHELQEVLRESEASARKKLNAAAKRLSKGGVRVTAVLDSERSAADAVHRVVQEQSASLVVLGTHGRTLFGGAFFGRTVRDVILSSPVGVVTVKSR
jgi:nucleotide-binding universal stress UspA family protein